MTFSISKDSDNTNFNKPVSVAPILISFFPVPKHFSTESTELTHEGKLILLLEYAWPSPTVVNVIGSKLTTGVVLDEVLLEFPEDVSPSDVFGVPFSTTGMGFTGDVLADLSEDMAAEEKARATYEHLIDLATDDDVIQPLLFLRQRELVHFARFKELYDYYKVKFGK